MSAQFLRKIDNMDVTVKQLMDIIKQMSVEMVKLEARITALETRKPVGRPSNGRKEATGGD